MSLKGGFHNADKDKLYHFFLFFIFIFVEIDTEGLSLINTFLL